MATMGAFEQRYRAALAAGDVGAAARWLADGAAAGDAYCAAQWGVWLLLGHGTPRDESAGFAMVRAAAEFDVPEARRLLATLYAQGRGAPEDWVQAVAWLTRSARAGDADAARQLAHLLPDDCAAQRHALLAAAARAGDPIARRQLAGTPARHAHHPPPPDWEAVAAAARRPEAPPMPVQRAAERPCVLRRDGVLPAALRDYLIGLAATRLQRATVNDARAGLSRVDPSRTNSYANLWLLEGDVVTDAIDRILAALVGLDPRQGEALSVLRYLPGEQYAAHYDFFDPDAPVHAAEIARGGQRILTCLVYLNADFSAGETAFVDAGFALRGEPGTAVWWPNADATGAPDRHTRHAGLPPAAGQKWLLSKWYRDRPQWGERAAERSPDR